MTRVVVLLVVAVLASSARADTEDHGDSETNHESEHASEAASPMRPDYDTPFHLFGWKDRIELEDRGLTIDPVYALDVFASRKLDDELMVGGLFVFEIDDLQVLFLRDRTIGIAATRATLVF